MILEPDNPEAPRNIRRRDKDSLGSQLLAMDGLVASARRHALRGDVESANKYVSDIENFIDANQAELEAIANATNLRSEDSVRHRELATQFLDGGYLRDPVTVTEGTAQQDIPLSALLNPDSNPAYEMFQQIKSSRSLGDKNLEALASGDPELATTSELYARSVGLKIGAETGEPMVYNRSPATQDLQRFFATQVDRFKNGDFGDLTDESLSQVLQEVIKTNTDKNPKDLYQMCDEFDNLLALASGDMSARSISTAAASYRSLSAELLTDPETKEPLPDDGTAADFLSTARQLTNESFGVGADSVLPSTDLFSEVIKNKNIRRRYRDLREHGAFDGMSREERAATLRALFSSELANTEYGPGLDAVAKYAESGLSRNLLVVDKVNDVFDDVLSKFVPPEGDDELNAPTEAQTYLYDPIKTLNAAAKELFAERTRTHHLSSPEEAIVAVASDQKSIGVLSRVLQGTFPFGEEMCDALASEYLTKLGEVATTGDTTAFDPDRFYTEFHSVEPDGVLREVKEENDRATGILTREAQGATLTDDDYDFLTRYDDRNLGLIADELDKFTEGGSFTSLGVEIKKATRELTESYVGTKASITQTAAGLAGSEEYTTMFTNVVKQLAAAADDPEKQAKITASLLNGDAGYKVSFPPPPHSHETGVTLDVVLDQYAAATSPEKRNERLQELVLAYADGDIDLATSTLSELYSTYVASIAKVTSSDAKAVFSRIYDSGYKRDIAQIRHTIDEKRRNGTLPKGVSAAQAEAELIQALDTVFKYEKSRHVRSVAGSDPADTLNLSTVAFINDSPTELVAVQSSIKNALYYGDDAQKAAAREAIRQLTRVYYGDEVAQMVVDNTAFAGVGLELKKQFDDIIGDANQAHAAQANQARDRHATTDTTILAVDLATIAAGAGLKLLAKPVLKGYTKKAALDAARPAAQEAVAAKRAALASKIRNRHAEIGLAADEAGTLFSSSTTNRLTRLQQHLNTAQAIPDEKLIASYLKRNPAQHIWTADNVSTLPRWLRGHAVSTPTRGTLDWVTNHPKSTAALSGAATGLQLALSDESIPYTPVHNAGVVTDQYDSLATQAGTTYDQLPGALQASTDTAENASYGLGSGLATVGSATLSGMSAGALAGSIIPVPGLSTAVGGAVGGVIGLVSGTAAVLYDVFTASSDTQRVEDEKKARIVQTVTSMLSKIQDDPDISSGCKEELAAAIAAQKITPNMSVDQKGQAYLRALQTFCGNRQARFNNDVRNVSNRLGGFYNATDEQYLKDRAYASLEAGGHVYTYAAKGGKRKSVEQAARFRRALMSQRRGATTQLDRATIATVGDIAMSHIGPDVSRDDPILRRALDRQLIDWTNDYNDRVKKGDVRGLSSNLRAHLMQRLTSEKIPESLRARNLEFRRAKAAAEKIPTPPKSQEQLALESQYRVNEHVAKSKVDQQNRMELEKYKAQLKENAQ